MVPFATTDLLVAKIFTGLPGFIDGQLLEVVTLTIKEPVALIDRTDVRLGPLRQRGVKGLP
jgi:hypothetical protein